MDLEQSFLDENGRRKKIKENGRTKSEERERGEEMKQGKGYFWKQKFLKRKPFSTSQFNIKI